MDEEDMYYVDSRNAVGVRPTIVQQQGGRRPMIGTRTIYVPHTPRTTGVQQYPMTYGPGTGIVPPYATGSAFGSLFGSLTTGQVIDMVAQVFAMLQPLPAAPTVTSDSSTDTGNSILYQQALASYAKRDEQVRTLGSIISKLVG